MLLPGGTRRFRLKVIALDDVRDSAAALQEGRADLAVVRPDVDLPDNALTLAILRDQAMIIASPEPSGLTSFPNSTGSVSRSSRIATPTKH